MSYSLLLYEFSAGLSAGIFGVLNMGEQRVINFLPCIFTLESLIVVGPGNVLSMILV